MCMCFTCRWTHALLFTRKGKYMTKDRARYKAVKYREWADLADKKREELSKAWYAKYGQFDWSEPIKLGHHSQRRHERVFEERDNFFRIQIELEGKAKRFREKAANLEHFANTNKGDAERKREQERQENDAVITVGSKVKDWVFGLGEVVKVNKKTYTVKWANSLVFTRDKSYVQPIGNPELSSPFTSDNF